MFAERITPENLREIEPVLSRNFTHFKTVDDILFATRGGYHPKERIRAEPIYYPTKLGDRYDEITGSRYSKVETTPNNLSKLKAFHPEYFTDDGIERFIAVPLDEISQVYDPFGSSNLPDSLTGIWKDSFQAIIEIGGINSQDVGVVGSFLLGIKKRSSDPSDVDFVIKGLENRDRLKLSLPKIIQAIGLSEFSREELDQLSREYYAEYPYMLQNCAESYARRWSTLRIGPMFPMTIHFVRSANELPPNPITSPIQTECEIEGRVTNTYLADFTPRVFHMEAYDQRISVVTYCWQFFSCTREGDHARVLGYLRGDNRTVTLEEQHHGIQIT